ncbi:hypothetical protein T1J70_01940 [Lactiplantibacillus plantarum]|nr:hypothetical protein [Lactiplantibacillus plantarum]WQG55376.1 hypothetical protein T1J70_01940 [Lactiplantibacillus plantarum]
MLAMTAIIWALAASSTSINGIGPFVGLIIGLVAGTWFIKRQQHVVAPLMPLTLFKKRIFTMGNVATFLLYAAMYGVVFFYPNSYKLFSMIMRGRQDCPYYLGLGH